MSLILDALRKSEAERRRAQSPDLFADVAPATAQGTRTSRLPWAWIAAIGAALLLAAWGLSGLRTANAPATTPPDATASLSAASLPTEAASPRAQAAPTPNDAVAMTATTPAIPATADAPRNAAAAPATVATAAPPAPGPARNAEPAPTTTPVTATTTIDAGTRPPALATAPAPSRPAPPIEAPIEAPTARPATLPSTASPLLATSPSFTSPTTTQRLSDLSVEERQQLPALKISMLMSNPAPERRFAIVDGNRVVQGDRLGPAVVEAIDDDGVVLAWQGRRLKVPIR